MRYTWFASLVIVVACVRPAQDKVVPDDLPPLPPPSDTPIGLLRGHAEELQLSGQREAALHALDDELQARNLVLQGEIDDIMNPPRPRPSGEDDASRGGAPPGGGGGGPMGGGAMGGGPPMGGGMGPPGGGPPGGGTNGAPARPLPTPVSVSPDQRARADELELKMRNNVRDYVARALDLLSVAQRDRAQELLVNERPTGNDRPTRMRPPGSAPPLPPR